MTKHNKKMWLTIIINIIIIHNGYGFNLENRLPIVKYGDVGTYFGYSLAAHEIGSKNESDYSKCLLIGAPLGQNLQPETNRSGALFKCPITQLTDDCTQVITDGRRDPEDDISKLQKPIKDEEIKDGQWMGVTVRSQGVGGKVLVCAHRYITKTGESQHGQGLCYILKNDLQYEDTYEPCKGRSTARAHQEYGYCQVGTSGTLLEDDTVVLGTPGPYTWRGTIYVTSFEESFLKRDKTMYYGPHVEQTSPVDKYSYLGMSVTGGRFLGTAMSYAAGAPRSNGNGQVIIFTKQYYTKTEMAVSMELDGEQFASSFGYELITADVNGDGFSDLIVSAPFYFSRHDGGAVYVYQNDKYVLPKKATLRLTGKLESRFGLAMANIGDINLDDCDDIAIGAPYDGDGVVFIYLGSKDGLTDKPSQIIAASDVKRLPKPIRTFGSSLSGGIDLDSNTYPDLLIGAYDSSAAIVLLARPITKIKTEVQSTELKNIDPMKQGCISDPSTNLTCFSFKACCKIEPYETSPTKSLELIYTIEAETFNGRKKFSRVFFGPDFNKRNNIVKRNIRVQTNDIMDCHEEIVYIKDNTRDIQSPIKFRLNYTIVEPPLPSSGLKELHPILDQTQAERPFEASFQKDCGTDDICESQLELHAELELEKERDQYTLVLGDIDEIRLNVNVKNDQDSAYEAQLFIEHQSSVSYIAASKGSVICNHFNNTIVACTLGNPLRRDASAQVTLRFDPSGIENSAPILSFKVFVNSTSKQIEPRDKTILDVRVVKKAELSIQGWATPEQSFYGGEIKGESAMKYFDDVGTSIQHTYQIYNDGPWHVQNLEVHIRWPHQVANDKPQGKWLLYLEDKPLIEGAGGGECVVKSDSIFNPLKLQRRAKSMDAVTFGTPEQYRKLSNYNKSISMTGESSEKLTLSKFSASNANINRVKRDRAMIIRAEQLVDKDGKKTDIVHMDCLKNTAKCVDIRCVVYNMQRKTEAYIYVKARLWNSTLVADYPRVDLVKIVSHAQIRIPDDYGILQTKKDDRTSVETRAYPELLDQTGDGTVPIWIIIISIVGGLLLLALFTFILWKFGFFKRRRPDPTLSCNLEKNGENKLLLQNNTKK